MRDRILFVSNVTSGLVSFRLELIQELAKKYEIYIMAKNNGKANQLIELGCKFLETSFDSRGTDPISDIRLYLFYLKEIKKINPKIVFTYTIKPNVYAGSACAKLNIPYVANITGLGSAVENGGFLQIITIPLYKYGLRKAKTVFFQNSANRDFMIKHHIISGLYDLLPGSGVNLKKYHLLDYPTGEVIHFVFISRIIKEKGIDMYLEAAQKITSRYPKVMFHVCGECSSDYSQIIENYNKSGIIQYHGKVEDIRTIHLFSSCTIHPSYYPEGMSNVLLESCACGRPIITTNRPGCQEIVRDSINGYLINQQNVDDLIEKIELFLKLSFEERKEMGLAGRELVENEYDRDIVIKKYLEIVEALK